jgi:hypothetical protein
MLSPTLLGPIGKIMKKKPIFILKFTRERGIKEAGNGKWIFPEEKTGKKQGEQVLYTII